MKPVILAAALAAGALAAPQASAAEQPPVLRLGSRPAEVLLAKITVSDLGKSMDFYTQVVGLREAKTGLDMPARDPDAAFVEIALNYSGSLREAALVLMRQKGAAPTRAAAELTWVALKVPDVRAVMQRARAGGFEVKHDVTVSPSGLVLAMVRDPDGYVVELLQAPSIE